MHTIRSKQEARDFRVVSDPTEIVRACVRDRTMVAMQFGYETCQARFVRLTTDTVEVQLIEQGPVSTRGAWCGMLFHHAGRACMGMGEFRPGDTPGHVLVRRPFAIQMERRAEPRLVIPASLTVSIRLGVSESWWSPSAVDMSKTGIGVLFEGEDVPDWRVGQQMRVEIAHGMDWIETPAFVVRRKGGLYGLTFISSPQISADPKGYRLDRILHAVALEASSLGPSSGEA
jgi:hypothetical protein